MMNPDFGIMEIISFIAVTFSLALPLGILFLLYKITSSSQELKNS
jgi:hypothetical protein